MSTLKINQTVDVYEFNGEGCNISNPPTIGVCNHWNHRDRVVLTVEGKQYTVAAADLNKAIQNATNC